MMGIVRIAYTTVHPQHALIARMALTDAGIEHFLNNEALAQMDGGFPMPPNPFEFQVRDADYDVATEVIREAVDRIRAPQA